MKISKQELQKIITQETNLLIFEKIEKDLEKIVQEEIFYMLQEGALQEGPLDRLVARTGGAVRGGLGALGRTGTALKGAAFGGLEKVATGLGGPGSKFAQAAKTDKEFFASKQDAMKDATKQMQMAMKLSTLVMPKIKETLYDLQSTIDINSPEFKQMNELLTGVQNIITQKIQVAKKAQEDAKNMKQSDAENPAAAAKGDFRKTLDAFVNAPAAAPAAAKPADSANPAPPAAAPVGGASAVANPAAPASVNTSSALNADEVRQLKSLQNKKKRTPSQEKQFKQLIAKSKGKK